MFSIFVSNAFDESVIFCKFLSILKLADVTPADKTKSRLEKSNYHPVGLLPNISKIFERSMHRQFQNILKLCYQNFNVVFGKGIAPKIVYYSW